MNLCVDEEIVDPNVTPTSLLTSTPKKVSIKLFVDKHDRRGTKHAMQIKKNLIEHSLFEIH